MNYRLLTGDHRLWTKDQRKGRALVAEEASARRPKLSGETIHRPVPRPGYQLGSMAGSITEKSIINDYAEGPAVTLPSDN